MQTPANSDDSHQLSLHTQAYTISLLHGFCTADSTILDQIYSKKGISWQPSGSDSALPLQEAHGQGTKISHASTWGKKSK